MVVLEEVVFDENGGRRLVRGLGFVQLLLVLLALGVSALVGTQVTRLSESLEAAGERTDVWLFASVSTHVSFEVEVEGEGAVADLALERLLACVDQLVAPQFAVIHEVLPTVMAHEYLLPALADLHVRLLLLVHVLHPRFY